MTQPSPNLLEYSSPPNFHPRIVLRTLSVLSLAPMTLAKAWLLFGQARSLALKGLPDPGDAIVRIVTASLLLSILIADLQLIWILTRGWNLRRRWIWPTALLLSLPLNILLPMCLGFSLGIQVDPLTHATFFGRVIEVALLLGIANAVLLITICLITDKDRHRRVRQTPH